MYTTVRGTPEVSAGVSAEASAEVCAGASKATGTARRRGIRGVGGGVVLLGLTSLFTDLSSEMVAAVLPLFVTLQLGLSPLQFGIIDGVYQGASVLVRVVGGFLADRWQRPKAIAVAGYGLSAACKLAMLPVTSLGGVVGVVAVDRTGKGIRTAPRDALIAANATPESYGTAFGVHRALDTVGALGGPLLAFAILALAPRSYDAVFVVSFCLALVGLAILVSFVRQPPSTPRPRALKVREVAGALHRSAFVGVVAAAALLAVLTVGDSFVYLALLRSGAVSTAAFPLLFVGTAVVYFVLAVPFGRLADRLGRARVFLAGHIGLIGCYLAVAVGMTGWVAILVTLGLLGAYYAATDGVLSAMGAPLVDAGVRTSGLAVLQTATASGRLLAAVGFGALWTMTSATTAFGIMAVALAVGAPIAGLLLGAARRSTVSARTPG